MTTNTAGSAARDYAKQLIHYLRKTINYNDAGITSAATVSLGTLPDGAIVLETVIRVRTAFNDSGTDTLKVGTSGDDDAFAQTTDSDLTATGSYKVQRGTDVVISGDTPVYIQYAGQNSNASAGQAEVIQTYVLNNDQ